MTNESIIRKRLDNRRPKGELLRDTGVLLQEQGYEIRVLDLVDMEKSHCYNPFFYLKEENDVQRLVTNLFRNTSPKGGEPKDPFWDNTAKMLLSALIFYLRSKAPPEEQNFAMVMEMLRQGEVREDNEYYKSPLDKLFDQLKSEEPDHVAVKYYNAYSSGAGKTLKSIQITLLSHLEKFNLDSVAALTMTDELELDRMGERRTALFAVIPENDSSFNFLVGILYTQLFQQLYRSADRKHGGTLPVPVHFLMDEFANVALPDDFDKLLSTMRSRGISVSILLQNLAQLKTLYEKNWESVVGNCDTFLYLGGNEQATHDYVSKLLGRETIDTRDYSQSRGRNGSWSVRWSVEGRDLLDTAEVRLLDNRDALLFVRGERPLKDRKYEVMLHPNVSRTADGGAQEYRHGEDRFGTVCVRADEKAAREGTENALFPTAYLVLSRKEWEAKLDEKRKEKEACNKEKKAVQTAGNTAGDAPPESS